MPDDAGIRLDVAIGAASATYAEAFDFTVHAYSISADSLRYDLYMNTDDIRAGRQAKLEAALMLAALELAGFAGAHGFMIPVPGTDPPLYVMLGEMEQLRGYVELD